MKNRIEKVQSEIRKRNVPAFFITRLANIRYLTGFSGSNAFLWITPGDAYFLSDFRYESQANEQVKDAKVIIYKKSLWNELASNSTFAKTESILVEANFFTLSQQSELKKIFPKVKVISSVNLIEEIAAIKDEEEIKKHKKAIQITDQVFSKILEVIKPGVRELDIGAEISYLHRTMGADGDSFEPIVASGERGALPHGRASNKKIKKGELVTLDFGCFYQGYASDLTRTVAVGKVKKDLKEIYQIVLNAQKKAIKSAKVGMKTKDLDEVARSVIRDAGHSEHFGHNLGHGLGVEVHWWPSLGPLDPNTLQKNMIFTIEPGIYIPGVGGVRIEDDVLLTEEGAKPLNKSKKDLIVL
ncbi:MAG: Xaa-Pro peptidase family protein [bacterium]|nr:Xaa-Pro peptidase family protein [bacterium]